MGSIRVPLRILFRVLEGCLQGFFYKDSILRVLEGCL